MSEDWTDAPYHLELLEAGAGEVAGEDEELRHAQQLAPARMVRYLAAHLEAGEA